MRLIKVTMVALLSVVLLSGCLFSHVKAPYNINLDKSTLGHKEGKASAYSVLWLVSWGDVGIAAAAKNGAITTVTHMDQEVVNILFGLYTKTSTIVYGD
jgi:TRL-like protein family